VSITEGTQPVPVHPTGTTATTAAFTPEASSLLVALVAADGLSGGPATTATVSDSLSGSWTLLVRKNAFNGSAPFLGGTVEVWIRDIGSSPASMTVTASGWSANGGNLTVRTLIGALPVAQQPGATGSAGSTGIAPTVTLTPTQIGSRIYGAALDYTTNATLTANANTTSIDQFVDAGNGDTWATFKASADTVSLTSTAYGYTNGNAEYQLAAAEILAASTADAGGHIQSGFHPGRGPTRARFYQTPKSYDVISAATINGTADLAGAGTLADVPVIQAAPATLTGAGTLSASGVIAGSATLTGAGTMAATVTQGAGSTPAGAGALSVAVTESATATLTGAGTLAATVTEGATASLAGAGTLTSPVVQRVIATLAGAGVLTATAGAGAIQGVASLAAAGSLTATATQAATATATGAGVLTATATQRATVTATGAGVLTATVRQGATAALSGAGTVAAIGTQAAPYTPILVSLDNSATGSGTITGSGAGSGLEDNTATSGTIDGSSAPSSLDDAGAVSVSGLLG
jgi:hypothetical protein